MINENRLGLDVIYVQAKRWQGNVGRKEIQSFVGALAGQQANKGVFITTSHFVQNAIDYANSVSQKVILIDGARLADFMVEHNIGVPPSAPSPSSAWIRITSRTRRKPQRSGLTKVVNTSIRSMIEQL